MAKCFAQNRHPGEIIDYRNTGTETLSEGEVVVLGDKARIGVVGYSIKPGQLGTLYVTQVFRLPKAAGAIALGAAVYYDEAAGVITSDETDNAPAGWAVEPAEAGTAYIDVKIG